MSFADRLRQDFSTLTLVLIPVAIAINIAIGQLIVSLQIPIYLDSIGTVLVAALAGPWAGLATGALTNLIWGLSGINPAYTPYAIVAAVIGLLAGWFANIGWFKSVVKVAIAGLITGVVAAALSAPITALVYGGVTGTATDVIVGLLQSAGASVFGAAFGQGLVSDPLDKLATFLVAWAIIRALPMRTVARFPRAQNVTA